MAQEPKPVEKLTSASSRRAFLRATVRGALLVFGVGGVTTLTSKRGRCDRTGACGGCPELGGCSLPQAVTFESRVEGREAREKARN